MSSSWAVIAELNSLNPEQLLLGCIAIAFLAFCLWCLVTWCISWFNPAIAIAIAPPLLRATLIAGCITGMGTTAHANENTVSNLNGLALPEQPLAQARGKVAEHTTPHTLNSGNPPQTEADLYTVRSGDSLWNIAKSHLEPTASNQTITNTVAAWHQHNSDVIGDNPDLIHPGQQLKEPRA